MLICFEHESPIFEVSFEWKDAQYVPRVGDTIKTPIQYGGFLDFKVKSVFWENQNQIQIVLGELVE